MLGNPIEIKEIIDRVLKSDVRLEKRRKQIEAFDKFYEARKHLFRPYAPKPKLRRRGVVV
ncbi:MAG: hypothetical protein H3Z52_01125 [archaeon]|nr:hypothetical protein [archaeon]MCP8319532.1 hypothetical protein [archaeon]